MLAFAAVLIGYVGLLVAIPYLATADGPSHLGAGVALWDVLGGGQSVVEDYTTLNGVPFTNALPDVPMGLLATIIGPQVAEKLAIGGFVVGFPLAVAFAIRSVQPRRWWFAFVALPFSFPFVLHYGFYPYCYGLLGFVLVAGWVLRAQGSWPTRATLTLMFLLTATYVAHVLPFVLAVAFIGVVALVDVVVSGWGSWRGVVRRWIPALVAAVPGLILSIVLVAIGLAESRSAAVTDGTAVSPGISPLVELVSVLTLAYGTVFFGSRETVIIAILAVLLAVLFLVALARRVGHPTIERTDATLVFAVLVTAAIVVLPSGANFAAGGSHLGQRLAPVPVVMLLMWLAGQDVTVGRPESARRSETIFRSLVVVVSLAVTIGLVAVRLPAYRATSNRIEGLVALAPCVAPNATVVQVNLGRDPVGGSLLTAETGRLTAAANGWDLGTIGAALPFFQLRNRPETDPYRYLTPDGSIEGTPPRIDPRAYQAATPGRVDYLIVAGRPVAEQQVLSAPSWLALDRQIEADFALVATSSDGYFELYGQRGPDGVAPVAGSACPT